jgi:hypothetical protein
VLYFPFWHFQLFQDGQLVVVQAFAGSCAAAVGTPALEAARAGLASAPTASPAINKVSAAASMMSERANDGVVIGILLRFEENPCARGFAGIVWSA